MKITKVETIVVNMPMVIEGAVVPKQGGRPRTSMDTLLARVDTDGGVSGWGEAFGHRIFPATKAALDTFIGFDLDESHEGVLGLLDQRELERHAQRVRRGPGNLHRVPFK